MAHSYRNTRAVLAAVLLGMVLLVAGWVQYCSPAVVGVETLEVPVLEVRSMGVDAKLYHLRLDVPHEEGLWLRWYGSGRAPAVGSVLRVRVTLREGGLREYRLVDAPRF